MTQHDVAVPSTVSFRSTELMLLDRGGDPYVPMKPVVEGIGLNWKSQHAKLSSSRFASTMVEITIVAADGKTRGMSCLPLRKLPGWLMTLYPNKVRPEIRAQVVAYQDECDDVLWVHWLRGRNREAFPALDLKEAGGFAQDYLAEHRQAIYDAGGVCPKVNVVAEQNFATGVAALLLRNKRWLVTFTEDGVPEMVCVPHDAGVFTPKNLLSWIRSNDGAYLTFMPELLHAIGDRLSAR